MRRFLSAVAVLAILAGCGGGGGGGFDGVSVEGDWSGSFPFPPGTVEARFTLEENSNGNVSGSVFLDPQPAAGELFFLIDGIRNGTSVVLTLSAAGFNPAAYTAEMANANLMQGRLDGSGFDNQELDVERQ